MADNPRAGVVVPGTGGVRKVRWAIGQRGKSGGVRVIYYFHDEAAPLFLVTIYAKSDQANLTTAERNALKRLVPALLAPFLRR